MKQYKQFINEVQSYSLNEGLLTSIAQKITTIAINLLMKLMSGKFGFAGTETLSTGETGKRYFYDKGHKCVRFNFTGNNISSIDLWDTGNYDMEKPSLRLKIDGIIDMVKLVPQMINVFKKPTLSNKAVSELEQSTIEESVIIESAGESQYSKKEMHDAIISAFENAISEAHSSNKPYVSINLSSIKEFKDVSYGWINVYLKKQTTMGMKIEKISKDEINAYLSKKNLGKDAELLNKLKTEITFSKSKITAVQPQTITTTTQSERMNPSTGTIFADAKTIFTDMEIALKMIAHKKLNSLIISGSAGVGKDFATEKIMTSIAGREGKDWILMKGGKATPMGLYGFLYNNNGKIIVFSDLDSMWSDDVMINILKGALDTSNPRKISWASKTTFDPENVSTEEYEKLIEKGQYPNRFEFTGQVVFISNLPAKDFDPAIRSRSIFVDVYLSPEDILKRIEDLAHKIKFEAELGVTDEHRNLALKILKDNQQNLRELTTRTFVKAVGFIAGQEVCGADDATIARLVANNS